MKRLLLVLAVLALTASAADAARVGGGRGRGGRTVINQRTVIRGGGFGGGFNNAAFVNRGFGFNSFAFATPFVFASPVVVQSAVIATPAFGFSAFAADPCLGGVGEVGTFGSSFSFRSRSSFGFR